MPEHLFNLPAHYVHEDSSVSEVFVTAYEGRDWMAVGPEGRAFVLMPDQARTLARVLLIAADRLDKEIASGR